LTLCTGSDLTDPKSSTAYCTRAISTTSNKARECPPLATMTASTCPKRNIDCEKQHANARFRHQSPFMSSCTTSPTVPFPNPRDPREIISLDPHIVFELCRIRGERTLCNESKTNVKRNPYENTQNTICKYPCEDRDSHDTEHILENALNYVPDISFLQPEDKLDPPSRTGIARTWLCLM